MYGILIIIHILNILTHKITFVATNYTVNAESERHVMCEVLLSLHSVTTNLRSLKRKSSQDIRQHTQ